MIVGCGRVWHACTYIPIQRQISTTPLVSMVHFVQWCSRMHTYKCEQSYATTAIIPLRGVYRFCLVNPDKDRGKYGAALPQSVKQIQPVLIRVSMHLFPRAVIHLTRDGSCYFHFWCSCSPVV